MSTLEARVALLEARLDAVSAAANASSAEHARVEQSLGETLNVVWFLVTACLIFLMQCGFCMLEAGSVRTKNMKNLLMKNLTDLCTCAVGWWFIGYSLAFEGDGPFMGSLGSRVPARRSA